jgi:hypothetical protein
MHATHPAHPSASLPLPHERLDVFHVAITLCELSAAIRPCRGRELCARLYAMLTRLCRPPG